MARARKNSASELNTLDDILLKQLMKRQKPVGREMPFRSVRLAKLAANASTTEGLRRLKEFLVAQGSFAIRFEKRAWQDVDGEKRTVVISRATSTHMWPMGTNYWIRDNAIIGARLLLGPDAHSRRKGRDVLLSCITIMSSCTQLKRFKKIISGPESYIKDPDNWPHIFLSIAENLHGAKKESWQHWQDAWQMMAYFVLEALDRGVITHKDLSNKHKKFLGYVIPFLCRVQFWKRETSGSWEEIPAVRSSVVVWDTMLVYRLLLVSHDPGYEFLGAEFKKLRKFLPSKFRKGDLGDCASSIFMEGLKMLMHTFPYESPHYKKSDVRHRTADATMLYMLQLQIPEFLAHITGQSEKWAIALERKILRTVKSLEDRVIGGFYRYGNDSYQGCGFFRHSTVKKLIRLYGGPSGDAGRQFAERAMVVPRGRKAAWVHPVWQLSAWAGRRFLHTGDSFYLSHHNEYFSKGLRLITGENEVTLEPGQSDDGPFSVNVAVKKLPNYSVPECYVSDRGPRGEDLIFPSPHTPLNWAVVEMTDAFYVREAVLKALKE